MFAPLMASFACFGTVHAAEFTQTACAEEVPGSVWLYLDADDKRHRSLKFGSDVNGVVFKGTTLSDGKWIARYHSFSEFLHVRAMANAFDGELVLVSRDGTRMLVGVVTSDCWQAIEKAVSGAVRTRVRERG